MGKESKDLDKDAIEIMCMSNEEVHAEHLKLFGTNEDLPEDKKRQLLIAWLKSVKPAGNA